MFDVDVTTCVALFLTNILPLKPNVKKSQSQKKPCFATVLFYSTVKIKIVSVTSEKIRYFFTVEKYQFYSHLICIEFTACDKINALPSYFAQHYASVFNESAFFCLKQNMIHH